MQHRYAADESPRGRGTTESSKAVASSEPAAMRQSRIIMPRRTFFGTLIARGAEAALAASLFDALCRCTDANALGLGVQLPPLEAEYYAKGPLDSVYCHLCPRQEHLEKGQAGLCRARTNEGGVLKTYGSGQPCVLNIDPIEKNPACHFLPGSKVLTLAHGGCNLSCKYCQNWEFSQKSPRETSNLRFDRDEALRLAGEKKAIGVTFTYTEGTTHIEFNRKLAEAARRMGLRTYLCSNGYVQEKPLQEFLEVLDGVTVTIKGFRDSFYKEYMGADSVKPVLESCKRIRASGKWLEVATLIVPGVNDDREQLGETARWICDNLGPQTPWHLERFTPKYMLANLPQTPAATMEMARGIGMRSGLKYVYISNLAPHKGNNTYCPRCAKSVIDRLGFKVLNNSLKGGRCPSCATKIAGVWT